MTSPYGILCCNNKTDTKDILSLLFVVATGLLLYIVVSYHCCYRMPLNTDLQIKHFMQTNYWHLLL
jgi:hypothetical protein